MLRRWLDHLGELGEKIGQARLLLMFAEFTPGPRVPRQDGVARWGFDPLEVLDIVRTAYGGEVVGQVYEGNRVFDVSVVLGTSNRSRISEISALPLRSPDGNYVTLSQLADVYESSARYVILHQGERRVQTITCSVQGRPVGTFVDEAKMRISN